MPIDAALFSGSRCYFFSGGQYIRVTRGDTGPGTVDPGYPASIASGWGWPSDFGVDGIDAALHSGSKTYFFSGGRYIRVTRGDTGPGTVDPGYPRSIASGWGWRRELVVVHFKSLLALTNPLRDYMTMQFEAMRDLFTTAGIEVRRGSTQDLSGDPDVAHLVALDVGPCFLGQPTDEHDELFAHRDGAGPSDLVIYVLQTLVGGGGNLVGCATHPAAQPGAAIVPVGAAARWLLAHEVGHVLSLRHVDSAIPTNSDFLMWPNIAWTNTPPDLTAVEATRMADSGLSRPRPF